MLGSALQAQSVRSVAEDTAGEARQVGDSVLAQQVGAGVHLEMVPPSYHHNHHHHLLYDRLEKRGLGVITNFIERKNTQKKIINK